LSVSDVLRGQSYMQQVQTITKASTETVNEMQKINTDNNIRIGRLWEWENNKIPDYMTEMEPFSGTTRTAERARNESKERRKYHNRESETEGWNKLGISK